MSKGTSSYGKHSGKSSHIACRRCGRHAYHQSHKICASCGFGKSSKLRSYTFFKKKD